MGRRFTFGVAGILGICLLCCGLVWFVAIPRARDTVEDGLREAVGTEVAVRVAPVGTVEPGEYVITEADLQGQFDNALTDNSAQVKNLTVDITPDQIRVGFTSGEQDASYTGRLVAVDGRIDVQDMETSSGFLDFLFPAGIVEDGIEAGVNNFLDANNVILTGLTMEEGQMTLQVEPAG
jgi:hypothetical protein